MISTGELKKGVTIELDGQLLLLLEWEHMKMGRGSAQVRLKLRNLRTGSITDRTFQAGEKFPRATLDRHRVQFQYEDGDGYHFMDMDSFDQIMLTAEQLGDTRHYLKDSIELDMLTFGEEPISVEAPITVDLKVVFTEPGLRGDTATASNKPAQLETGLSINVPLFVKTGDVVRVDTRTGEYLERA